MIDWCCKEIFLLVVVFYTTTFGANSLEERVSFTVQEGASAGYVIGTIPRRAGFTYYVNEKSAWFNFDPGTGVITAAVELDREQMPSDVVDLVILGRQPTYFITARITVLDVNDERPTFLYPFFNVSIPESAAIGTTKVLPSARDDDKDENGRIVRYSLDGGFGTFRLRQPTDDADVTAIQPLLLQLVKPVDREQRALYTLNITAVDGGTPPNIGRLTVFVNVQDTNDNAPIFAAAHYNVSVPESVGEGSRLLSVTATDADDGTNAQIMYRLSNDPLHQFTVDSISGDITTNVARLNCPPPAHCQSAAASGRPADVSNCARTCVFTAEAVDHGLPPQRGRAFVNVMIIDENDHRPTVSFRPFPTATNSYASVAEDAKVGSLIALVTVTDEDIGENGAVDVQIESGNELGYFELAQDGFFKLIKLKKSVYGTTSRSFKLKVSAVDRGDPPKRGDNSLMVYVRDIDDRPPKFASAGYAASVPADGLVDSYVTEITASYDLKPKSLMPKTVYSIIKGNEDGYFNLSSKTGLITVSKSLTSSSLKSFNLKISAKKDGPSIETAFTNARITIEEANLNTPRFSEIMNSMIKISENTPVGSPVIKLAATDLDSGLNGRLMYEFASGPNKTHYKNFVIDSSNGVVYLLRTLDRETTDSYSFLVKVSDSGLMPKSATTLLRMQIIDANDNAPFFKVTEYHRNLLLTDPIGSFIAQLEAIDLDLGDTISYFFQSEPTDYFQLDAQTGIVTLKMLPPQHTSLPPTIKLSVSAQDSAGHLASNNASVHIYILADANDLPTFVQPAFHFTIMEDSDGLSSIGRAIGTTSATDYDFDSADQIKYRITAGDQANTFAIGVYSGELRSRSLIDHERLSTDADGGQLTVVAIGQSGATETAVNVTVLDANDNRPVFTSNEITDSAAQVTLDTDALPGAIVFDAAAVDADSEENGRVSYAIETEGDQFVVDGHGRVILNTAMFLLTNSTYELIIRASDSGQPSLSTSMTLLVKITHTSSVNNKTDYTFTVQENTPVNTRLQQINLSAPNHCQLIYADVAASDDNAPFSIFPDGWIYIKNDLDFEKMSYYRMVVQARCNDVTITTTVNFGITDVNDNDPQCDKKLFRFGLKENSPLFAFVGFVGASDDDSGLNGAIIYKLLDHNDLFQLNSVTGALSSVSHFDRESSAQLKTFHIRFRASDAGDPRRSVDCEAVVEIEDENDNPPVFQIDVFAANIPENYAVEQHVLKVTANDVDLAENGEVAYQLATPSELFFLNETSGDIRLLSHLDRESAEQHKLVVIASDNGRPRLNSTALVLITVTDVNDNAPRFTQYPMHGLNVSEDKPIGTRIASFRAVDDDVNLASQVVYSLATGNTGRVFEIDPSFGDLILVGHLDYETTSAYTLTVKASDKGSPSLSTSVPVVINVLDVNDNEPKIETTIVKVEENLPAHSPIGKIAVTDADSAAITRLRCTLGDQRPSAAFTIDKLSGDLVTVVQLDRETVDTYSLQVLCADTLEDSSSGAVRHVSEKTVTVIVTDRNDNAPRFAGPLAATFDVNKAIAGYRVAQLTADDADDDDLNGNVAFTIDPNPNSDADQLFGLRSDGTLFLKTAARGYRRSKYEMTVVAKDRANNGDRLVRDSLERAQTTSAQFTVIPLPFDPGRLKFERDTYELRVSEDAAIGSPIGGVVGSGSETLEYYVTESLSVLSGASVDHYVAVDVTTGRLTVQRTIDREIIGETLKVRVTAVDPSVDRPSAITTTILVTIIDVNDEAPRPTSSLFTFAVAENQAPGVEVGRVSATDDDTVGRLAFSFAPPASPYFAIDSSSGVVRTTRALDRERRAEHRLAVDVSDGVHSTRTQVLIGVQDENDNAPVFTEEQYEMSVSEGAPRNAFVGRVVASDKDEGANANVRYRLNDTMVERLFRLDADTGALTVAGFLDAEEQAAVRFEVIAQDEGTPSLSTSTFVFVSITDINDNEPYFVQSVYSATVSEDAPVGSVVIDSIACYDKDLDTYFDFKITQGDPEGQFRINRNATVSVARALDRETRDKHQLTVTCYDRSSGSPYHHSASAKLDVTLSDVNDNAPRFTSAHEALVAEDAAVGTVVTIVRAVDADAGVNGSVLFRLGAQSAAAGVFSVDPVLGYVRVNRPLDREKRARYNLSIYAEDNGAPRRRRTEGYLVVHVGDVDDHPPEFLPHPPVVPIAEDASVSTTVIQFGVRDRDVGDNASAVYWIVGGDDRQDFEMAATTGVLTVARPLSFHQRPSYNLSVAARAVNAASAEAQALTWLLVQVADTNDCPPTFAVDPIELNVYENLFGPFPTVIGDVIASDCDSGLDAKLSYSIIHGNTTVFSVDSMNGYISQHIPLDREAQEAYELTIEAMDAGSPRLRTTARLVVRVMDQNDNDPVFNQPKYAAVVEENQLVGTVVTNVSAHDADSGEMSRITFSLGKHVPFTIDQSSGVIRTAAVLDRERVSSYIVTVAATDSDISMPRSTSTTVTIRVADQNDNRPIIRNQHRDIYIKSSLKAGDFVYAVNAFDPDENTVLNYSLSGDAVAFFSIDASDGFIKTRSSLDVSRSSYALVVSVQDLGRRALSPSSEDETVRLENTASTTSALLTFYLKSASEFPVFKLAGAPRQFTVSEGQKDFKVAAVVARSPKAAPVGRIAYAIAGGNVGDVFRINSQSGVLSTTGRIDRELASAYRLWVSATDADNPPLTAFMQINVDVTDKNDCTPEFAQPVYTASIFENELPLVQVLQVLATDCDLGQNSEIRYELDNDANVREAFKIDERTGVIKTVIGLDRERQNHYRFNVKATDGGTPKLTGTATVEIEVLDVNDNAPKFTRLFRAQVAEDAPIGAFVTQVTASDADSKQNSNNTFRLSVNPGAMFAIDAYSGNVTVRQRLDRETVDSYPLKVTAVDGSWRIDTALTIRVTDVNDNAPTFTQSVYRFNVSELQPPLSPVGRIHATDADNHSLFAEVSYKLAVRSSSFKLDAKTGQVSTLKPFYFNRNGSNKHELEAVAEDGGTPRLSSRVKVEIFVTERNSHSPLCTAQEATVAISADLPPNSRLHQVTATDKDEGRNGMLSYQLISEDKEDISNALDLFSIDSQSGWIRNSKQLSSVGTQYKLTTIVKDFGTPARTIKCSTKLEIVDANLHDPEFPKGLYQLSVVENTAVGTVIDKLEARDLDNGLNGELRYKIVTRKTPFEIDAKSGMVSVKMPLDHEKRTVHNFSVTASDLGAPRRSATVKISIVIADQNDNAPKFNSSFIEMYVLENRDTVGEISVTDPNKPATRGLRYSILSDTDMMFRIDETSGVITLRRGKKLDFEMKKSHTILVRVENTGAPDLKAEAIVLIHVLSQDEFPPKFENENYMLTVDKSTPPNTVVGVVKATDADHGEDGIAYYFIADLNARRWFNVHQTKGTVSVMADLSDLPAKFEFDVYGKNKHSTPEVINMARCRVAITVLGGRRYIAAFGQVSYEATVLENSPRGTSVLKLAPSSGDSPARYTYSIIEGNTGAFAVSSETGIVQVVGSIDREYKSDYRLVIGAKSKSSRGASSGFTSTAKVDIIVKDVNDNPPRLSMTNAVGHISEGDPPYTNIMLLTPEDADLPPNKGPFKYRILDTDLLNSFEIDETTGVIRSKVVFDREQSELYKLLLEIYDAGQPRMISEEQIFIHVGDVNDSPPTDGPVTITVVTDQSQSTVPSGNVGSGHPADEDLVGGYNCNVEGEQLDNAEIYIDNDCSIKLGNSAASSQTVNIEGNDGIHNSVNYSLTVNVRPFSKLHLANAIDVSLSTPSAKAVIQLMALLPPSALLLNSRTTDSGSVNLVSIPTKEGTAAASLVKQLDLPTVTGVVFDLCAPNPCAHGGRCRTQTEVQQDVKVAFLRHFDTGYAFAHVARRVRCECAPTYGGARCETLVDHCQSNPCHNGGVCSLQAGEEGGIECRCRAGYTGRRCESDVDECSLPAACQNGGYCENTPGSFKCICLVGFGGDRCEQKVDYCRSAPCLNNGRCSSERNDFRCSCQAGFSGKNCQIKSYSFDSDTFVELPSLHHHRNYVSMEFSTMEENALLLCSYNGAQGSSDYIGVDIVAGRVRLSADLGVQGRMNLMPSMRVNDGRWYQLQVDHKFRSVSISVSACTFDGLDCDVCDPSNTTCSLTADHGLPHVLVPGESIYLGGVRNFSDLLKRPGQLSCFSFVGCIRAFQLNERTLETIGIKSQHPRSLNSCQRHDGEKTTEVGFCSSGSQNICGSGRCSEQWNSFHCECTDGYKTTGIACDKASDPYSFNGGYVEYRLRPAYSKQLLFTPIDPATVVNSDDLFPFQRGGRDIERQLERNKRSAIPRPKRPPNFYRRREGSQSDQALLPGLAAPSYSARQLNRPASLPFQSADLIDASSWQRQLSSAAASSLFDGGGNWLEIDFRTLSQDGLIFFAALSRNDFYILDISNGTLRYLTETSNPNLRPVKARLPYFVSDGNWHTLQLALSADGKIVEWGLDGSKTKLIFKNDAYHEWFLRSGLQFLTIGGFKDSSSHDGYSHMIEVYGIPVPEFTGCIRRFVLNGEVQPLSSSTESVSRYFDVVSHGNTVSGCFGPMGCDDPPCSAEAMGDGGRLILHIMIAVFVFVAIMLAVIFVSWLLAKRWRRRKADDQHSAVTTKFGNMRLISAPLSAADAPPYGRGGGGMGSGKSDSSLSSSFTNQHNNSRPPPVWLRNEDAVHHQSRLSVGTTHRADSLVGLDAAVFQIGAAGNAYQNNISTGSLDEIGGRVGRVSANPVGSDLPIRYDLDNASSIAPSDIDVSYHYKGYHDGSNNRRTGSNKKKQSAPGGAAQSPLSHLTAMTNTNNAHHRSSPASVKQLKAALRASPASVLLAGPQPLTTTSSSEDQRPSMMTPVASNRPPVPAPRRSRRSRRKNDSPATSSSLRRRQQYTNATFRDDDDTSSSETRPPLPPVHSRTPSNGRSRIRSSPHHRPPPAPVDDSSTENHSEIESVDCTTAVDLDDLRRLDLDRVRNHNQLLAYQSETETEYSDFGGPNTNNQSKKGSVPTSLAPFRPPRSMFPASEDDSDATTTADVLPNTFRPIGKIPALPPRPSKRDRDAQPSPPSWYHQVEQTDQFASSADEEALNGSVNKNNGQNLEAFV